MVGKKLHLTKLNLIMISIALILKLSLLSSSMFLILGPAFVWEHSAFFSAHILNNSSGGIGGEFIRISGPFFSVLLGLVLLYALTEFKKIFDWSKGKFGK